MHIDKDSKLEIFVEGDQIILKKHRPAGSCDFCGELVADICAAPAQPPLPPSMQAAASSALKRLRPFTPPPVSASAWRARRWKPGRKECNYRTVFCDLCRSPLALHAKGLQGAAEKHYPTMGINELCTLPVADLAAPDSVLFLWATFPQLPEALRLIKAWGFQYKSVAFVWLKKNRKADSWFYGLGFWTRGNAEVCLLATKGHPKRQAANIHQFIISPIEAHSKKPDEAREKIVALMGDLPRVELFARQSPPGWEVWGNEVKSTIPDFGTKCPEVKGAGKEADPCPM